MTQPSLIFDRPVRRPSDTSRLAFQHLQPLKPLDLMWLMRVFDYLEATGAADVTGAELAAHYGVLRTDTRPRLSGCFERGWLAKASIRPSRAAQEGRCRGYVPNLPRAAVERAQRTPGKA